ncbi:uncharacterized protein LOC136073158 isoform X2 [Hydra vulgaris]|uniref:uncharacterized protein LOC136073158 isoform X2 n=1 Tax=Hydra vulgaris TaxID=6087 RepID=UPI0032EA3E85
MINNMEHKEKMTEVGSKLNEEDVKCIKYILAEKIVEGIKKIINDHKMFTELERTGFVNENNYKNFITILDTLNQADLVSIIYCESQPVINNMERKEKITEVFGKLNEEDVKCIKYILAEMIVEGIKKIINDHEMITVLKRFGFASENSYKGFITLLGTLNPANPLSINNGESQPDFANVEVNRTNIKNVLARVQNDDLMKSSEGKNIVLFIGNTGSGKSTLINYLIEKELLVDENDNIVLKNQNDASAMMIGDSVLSKTLLPKFIELDHFLLYDLPGFNDTRGLLLNLVNAAFLKNIIENAKTVRFVIVTCMEEIAACRGELFMKLLSCTNNLLSNESINEISGFVITKTQPSQSNDQLVKKIKQYTGDNTLIKWLSEDRLAYMKLVHNKSINQDDRKIILDMINKIKEKDIKNVKTNAVLSLNDRNTIKQILIEEMQEVFDCLLKNIINTTEIKDYSLLDLENKIKELNYLSNNFKFDSSTLCLLLEPLLCDVFDLALKEFNEKIKNDVEEIILLVTVEVKDKQLKIVEKFPKEKFIRHSEEEKNQKKILSIMAEIKSKQHELKKELQQEKEIKVLAKENYKKNTSIIKAEMNKYQQFYEEQLNLLIAEINSSKAESPKQYMEK